MKLFFMFFWVLITKIYFKLYNDNINFKKKKKFKIAVLKPYFYLDLYTKSSKNLKNILYSSWHRSGPVGLFADLNADFFITRSKIDLNLQRRIKKRLTSKENKQILNFQKKNSIDVNKINFNNYDLVLSYEGGATTEIIKKYQKPKWGIILEDHSHFNFKKFIFFKPKFFDFFLNLTQGFTPYSLLKRSHCIDFSYTFGSSNFLNRLNIKKHFKIDILIEIQQPKKIIQDLNLDNLKIIKLDGSLKIKDYIKKQSETKIFFCPIFTTPRWGNSIIEAAMCKSLIVGNKNSYWNSLLIHPDLHCTSVSKGRKIIIKVLSNKKIYNYYISQQNKLLDKINYRLPMQQISKLLD